MFNSEKIYSSYLLKKKVNFLLGKDLNQNNENSFSIILNDAGRVDLKNVEIVLWVRLRFWKDSFFPQNLLDLI